MLTFSSTDGGYSRGLLYLPCGKRPRVGVHLMHPRTDQTHNYNILPFVEAGCAVLGRSSRWVNNDIATIHEQLLLDMAEGVKLLRQRGCEHIVLLGNSGGGTLAAFYQSQARRPVGERLTDTAAGDAFDLNQYDLPTADAIVFVACHVGEGEALASWLDPSIVEEADRLSVIPELDMYSFDNGFRVPPQTSHYSQEFLQAFYAAQKYRAARLDAVARARVAERRRAFTSAREMADAGDTGSQWQWFERRAQIEGHMPIYRAMANPRFVDLSLDPDDRDVCAFNSDPRPDLMNYRHYQSPFLTPEAYLSTWSGPSSRANSVKCLSTVSDPFLCVHYRGDSICSLTQAREMCAASDATDKELITFPGLDHYGFKILGRHERGERDLCGARAAVDWVRARYPV